MATIELEKIGSDFIKENGRVLKQDIRKGGPYSKAQRTKRRNEVFKLHFDYGYSSLQISEMMKVNRNTINSDINFWYGRLSKEWESYDTESWYMKQMHRMETQRTRLMEQLKQENLHDRLAIEKMILDIDAKITQTAIKISTSEQSVLDLAVRTLNDWAKEHKLDVAYIKSSDLNKVKGKTGEKIMKLIKEDRKRKIAKDY